MSMINEQVRRLRRLEVMYGMNNQKELAGTLSKAADTIESLSAKPQAANCGGWIPCSERMPEVEQGVLLSLRSLDVCNGYRANTKGMFYVEGEGYVEYKNVLAWQPIPEPYHES